MSDNNPSIQPALTALTQLRGEIKKRVGKEGGNLNDRLLTKIDVIEGVLKQIPSVQAMFNVINQQAQLATMTFRHMALAAHAGQEDSEKNGQGDDPKETKGA
jgi:hypothetical protein